MQARRCSHHPVLDRFPDRASIRILFAFLLAVAGGTALAEETPVDAEPVTLGEAADDGASLLFVTDHPGLFVPAPRLSTEVSIRVTGLVVRASVRQRFTNPHEHWLEGIYVFPLPEDAAVDTLRLVVGERVIVGEIQEREAARLVYEQAKAAGQKASLVEQERPNLFTTSVANIGPGESVDLVIEYQENLRWDSGSRDSGRFELRFPMVANRRYIPGRPAAGSSDETEAEAEAEADGVAPAAYSGHGWATATDAVPDAGRITPPQVHAADDEILNPVSLSVDIDLGLPIDRITSPSHALDIERLAPGAARVAPADGTVPANRDFILRLFPERGAEPTAALLAEEHEGETYYLLLLVPPTVSPELGRVPRETIFVLDTSGSMSGTSITQAKRALLDALDRLPPGDTFNLVEFDSTARRLFDHPVPADAHHLGVARRFVDRLRADGGTEMRSALELALDTSENAGEDSIGHSLRQVIFITDGSVGNEDDLFRYIRSNLGRSRLFPVGIGSAPNGHFLRRAAEHGGGTATFIATAEEVRARMGELFDKIEHPVLSDLELLWDDTSVASRPEHPGDLYLGEPLVITARAGTNEPSLRIRGWLGNSPWERDIETTNAARGVGLHKLWARREIASLDDALSLLPPGSPDESEGLRSKIVEVGLAHHLVSRFTSLVAVDTTPSRPEDEALTSRPLPIQTPAGWTPPSPGTLPAGGTASRLEIVAGLLLLIGALAWLWRRGS